MRPLEWTVSRAILSLLLALLLLAGTSAAAFAQATPDASPTADGAGPVVGDAVILYDSGGDEQLQIAVTQIADPDDAVGDSERGFRWVGIELVASNVASEEIQFDPYAVQLVDDLGFVYNYTFASREEDDLTARPDFVGAPIPTGESISGWLFYQVVSDAAVDLVVLNDPFSTQQFAVLANVSGETVSEGDEITFTDTSGDEAGTVTVDEVITEFEDVDSGVAPPRGFTVVGVNLTITNTGSGDLQPNTSAFTLVDDFGYVYYPMFYSRGEESLAEYPDLTSDLLPAGESVTGLILFELPSGALVNYVVFMPDFTQLYIVAQPGPGSAVSGETLTPVSGSGDAGGDAGGETGGAETGDCVGVADWADETEENLEVLDLFEGIESLADVEPAELRDAADQLRDVADEQADLDVPAVAEAANEGVITLLDVYADLYDEAADRLDDGDAPAEIEADLDANEESAVTLTEFFAAYGNLTTACPDSDV